MAYFKNLKEATDIAFASKQFSVVFLEFKNAFCYDDAIHYLHDYYKCDWDIIYGEPMALPLEDITPENGSYFFTETGRMKVVGFLDKNQKLTIFSKAPSSSNLSDYNKELDDSNTKILNGV